MLEKRRTYNENKVETIIGPGTKLTAEIESKGTIRIEGELTGRVHSDDTIVVHDTGKVRADLVAGQVIVSGHVEGNLFAHDRIEVTNKARLIGNISAPRLSIAEGVVFEGHCTMMKAGEAKTPEFASPIISFERAKAANLAAKAE
ncbi:MAG: polymer-forming cytoskeletal protein [Candidatus Hydrogenedentota bacterium]